MIINIRKIGNSQGIIIPKDILDKIGYPNTIEITVSGNIITLSPLCEKIVRRKPRDEDEINGFYELMKSKLENKINSGEIVWTTNREMEWNI